MYCRTCGKELVNEAVVCTGCGVPPLIGKKFCQGCGAETSEQAVVCVKCGVSLTTSKVAGNSQQVTKLIQPSNPPKDPTTMCVLSAALAGLGQIILGQTAKGIILFIVSVIALISCICWIGLIAYPLICAVSAIDAHKIATKLKNGKSVEAWEFF